MERWKRSLLGTVETVVRHIARLCRSGTIRLVSCAEGQRRRPGRFPDSRDDE